MECAAWVLGVAAGFPGVAGYSLYPEQGDDEVGDGGPDLGRVSGADECASRSCGVSSRGARLVMYRMTSQLRITH